MVILKSLTRCEGAIVSLNNQDTNSVVVNDADINRFWAPRMRKLLLEYAANDDQGLSVELLSALKILKQA